jgi:hypothetical protein
MPKPAGNNDSIITFGLDMMEETEQNMGVILDAAGKSDGNPEGPEADANDREAAELEEARAVAEEARRREQEEHEQERQQEQQRER